MLLNGIFLFFNNIFESPFTARACTSADILQSKVLFMHSRYRWDYRLNDLVIWTTQEKNYIPFQRARIQKGVEGSGASGTKPPPPNGILAK